MVCTWPVAAVEDVVLSIEVTGNQEINDDQILRAITNIRLGEPLNQASIIQDRQAIMNLGYFSMIEPYVEEFLGGVKVVFKVVENPTIKGFKVEGLERIKPDEVISFLTQKPGEVFNYIKTMNDLVMAQQYFNEKKGLLIPPLRGDASEMNGLMEIDDQGLVTLHLYEVRLGKVIFKGLEKTQEFVVARQISLKEGEVLDFNQLREDVQQIARLQLFDDINPRLQPTDNPKLMDVVIEFKEGENRLLSLGVTYTPVDNQLLGSVGIVDPNLMGLGQSLSFNMELNPNNVFNLNFEFYEPWLDEKETSLGLKLFSNHTLSLSGTEKVDGKDPENENQYTYKYNEKRTGLNLTLGRPLQRNLRVDTSFHMERVTIDPKEWIPLKTNTYEPDADKTLDYPSNLNQFKDEYWNNSLGLGLSYNKLLYTKNYTTGGYLANLGFNLHGGIFGGDYNYQHLYGEFKQFYSPFNNTTLGYRIKGGKILGSPPDSSKLYLGGELSLRGYDIRHVEGDQQVLANVELRQRIPNTENLEAVLFYDLGTVDFDRYYQSYGVGFRYNIPLLGQLRFDFAWTPEGGKPKFNFFFGEMF
jgi:outer membrane protein insertion porin family